MPTLNVRDAQRLRSRVAREGKKDRVVRRLDQELLEAVATTPLSPEAIELYAQLQKRIETLQSSSA